MAAVESHGRVTVVALHPQDRTREGGVELAARPQVYVQRQFLARLHETGRLRAAQRRPDVVERRQRHAARLYAQGQRTVQGQAEQLAGVLDKGVTQVLPMLG